MRTRSSTCSHLMHAVSLPPADGRNRLRHSLHPDYYNGCAINQSTSNSCKSHQENAIFCNQKKISEKGVDKGYYTVGARLIRLEDKLCEKRKGVRREGKGGRCPATEEGAGAEAALLSNGPTLPLPTTGQYQ
ncbi:hypothetical protein LUU34_00791300 [Aix galericulata]|nr:hypothetical protein LUU34_00791300 [Aix galericulata]